jgi:tRNA nucleotidyltransferase/poly(A) polymerase
MLVAPGPSRAMRLMADTGMLATTLPELDVLPEPVLERALRTLDVAAQSQSGPERLALAALLGEVGPETARSVLLRLRVSSREADAVALLVATAPASYTSAWSDVDVRRYMRRVPAELLPELLELRAARALATASSDPEQVARETELAERVAGQQAAASPLTLPELAVDGRDLCETLGLPEGPVIGTILERLLSDVIEDPSLNTRMTLLTRAGLVLDQSMHGDGSGTGPAGPPIR